jgi:hypothetical protein
MYCSITTEELIIKGWGVEVVERLLIKHKALRFKPQFCQREKKKSQSSHQTDISIFGLNNAQF